MSSQSQGKTVQFVADYVPGDAIHLGGGRVLHLDAAHGDEVRMRLVPTPTCVACGAECQPSSCPCGTVTIACRRCDSGRACACGRPLS